VFGLHLSSAGLAAVALIFVLAGLVKGVTGMGLPAVAMGLLGAFMPPVAAAALLIIPATVTNVWQLFTGPDVAGVAARLKVMMLGIVMGTLAGSWLLTQANSKWTTAGLGAALAAYALYSLLAHPPAVPRRAERWLSPLVGLITGLVSGATGVFSIPSVPYIQGMGLGKNELIQALGLTFTVCTLALAAGLALGGALHVENATASALAMVPAFAGMWLGTAIRGRIGADTFRRWFLIFLAVLGADLMARPLF